MPKFIKKALSISALVSQWQGRGMLIEDEARMIRYLSHISYYRLSAYTIPFQVPNSATHVFKAGVTFDDVLSLYVFDRELRLLVLDAIERIEVAVRTQLCNGLSVHYDDPFWYLEEGYFKDDYQHMRLLSGLERKFLDEKKRLLRDESSIDKRKVSPEIKKILKDQVRKENFIRHYLAQGYRPRLPPSWMMVEMLTWGDLNHLYQGLRSVSDQKIIAQALGINEPLLTSWLGVFNDVRNFCAHHSRLWNREFGRNIKVPQSDNIRWVAQPILLGDTNIRYEKRLYGILVALQCILFEISPYSSWASRLKMILDKYPEVSRLNMGMPLDWMKDPFWLSAFKQGRA